MNAQVAAELKKKSWRPASWRNALLLVLLYSGLWLLLSGNQGWLFGGCFVVVATLLSWRLALDLSVIRYRQLPAFLFLYLSELFVAAWQVASSACRPTMPIAPRWVAYPLTSRDIRTQMLLASFVCLLPGTLTSQVRDGQMHIHLLNAKQPWRPTVERMETRLMALLGENRR